MEVHQILSFKSGKLFIHRSNNVSPRDLLTFHTHDIIEIIHFLSGDVSYIVEGRHYKIKENDIFVVAPSVYHRVKIDSPVDYDRYDILIDGSTLPNGLVESLFAGNSFAVQNATPEMKNIFERLACYCERFETKAVDDLAVSLMTELFYNMLYDGDRSKHMSHSMTNRTVQNAIEYIDSNITELEGLDELYRYLNVSKCHFHRMFLRELGMTPMDYIRDRRLSIARRLLHDGHKPADVYSECGFSSYTAFYRSYKATYGYPPSGEAEMVYPEYVIRS